MIILCCAMQDSEVLNLWTLETQLPSYLVFRHMEVGGGGGGGGGENIVASLNPVDGISAHESLKKVTYMIV